MRHPVLAATVTVAVAFLAACGPVAEAEAEASAAVDLENERQRASYAIGQANGTGLAQEFGDKVDIDAFIAGVVDAFAGEAKLTDEEMQTTMRSFIQARQAERRAEQTAIADANLADSEAWLAEIEQQEGVQKTESGLLYRVVEAGTGETPTAANTVTVHYRGEVRDGRQFDSSYDRGQPASFPVTGVIAGWTEALQLMPVGSTWDLWIHPDLAYGSTQRSAEIVANAALYFRVELLSFE